MNIMHISSIIDTLDICKRLVGKGVKEEQAQEFTNIFKEREDVLFHNLASKNDLKNEIDKMRADVKSEFNDVRKDIKISMLTSIISIGTIVALIEKFL